MHGRILTSMSDLLLLLTRDMNLQRSQVLLQPVNPRCARNRDKLRSLRQDPRKRKLASSDALLLRERADFVHQLQVLGEVLLAESGRKLAKVALLKVAGAANLAADHAAADGRVAHNRHSKLATSVQQVDFRRLNVQREWRVLNLHAADRMNLVRAAQAVCAAFGETEVFDFAFLLELGHGFDGELDGGFAVEAVAVVEVDAVNAEAAEGFGAGFFAVRGAAVDLAGAVGVYFVCELIDVSMMVVGSKCRACLCGQEYLLTLAGVVLEPLAEEVFTVLVPNEMSALSCCGTGF